MGKNINIHPVQVEILLILLFKQRARFSDLNKAGLTNDHFTFHLKQLQEDKLVIKQANGKYSLTKKGKEFANRFDTDEAIIERQAKVGVLVCCVKKEKGKNKYLIQQRLKQPYYGFHGFLTGKIRWGERVETAAARELKEETGLKGTLKLVGVKHKMDYSKKNKLLEDKFLFVFGASNTKGKLLENFEGGKNMWLTEREINKLPNLFDGVDETLVMSKKNKFVYSETKYKVKRY